MAQTRYRALRIGIVMLCILDNLRRMLYGARPIDNTMLVIELLVLVLIAAEVFYKIGRHFKVRHRTKRLRERLAWGQKIQSDAPAKHGSGEWMYQVSDWIDKTDTQLKKYSLEASLAFRHDPGAMFNPFVADSFGPDAKPKYLRLQHCLNNLRKIIEEPDVYL